MLAALLANTTAAPAPVAGHDEVGVRWFPDRARRKRIQDEDEIVLLMAAALQPWRK